MILGAREECLQAFAKRGAIALPLPRNGEGSLKIVGLTLWRRGNSALFWLPQNEHYYPSSGYLSTNRSRLPTPGLTKVLKI